MKNKRLILLSTLCLSVFTAFPAYAVAPESELSGFSTGEILDSTLDENYYVDDNGYIVADLIPEEEIKEIETMCSENDKNNISDSAIDYALSKVGCPYSKAKRDSGSAYDCSSLVYYSYLNANLDLSYEGSNTAAALAKGLISSGKEVSSDDMQPGDLIFYSHSKNGRYHNITHVAMYVGDGMQVEASSGRKQVVFREHYSRGIVNVCRPMM